MAMIEFDAFSFRFPKAGVALPAAGELSLHVEGGAFCLLTGLTGCGKTTLLRACKPELAPSGEYAGSLDVCGVRLVDGGRVTGAMDSEASARSVGFVMQDPDAQIVCDTVWHELAFALENLGTDPDLMRRRVAEVAHYLGIAPWVDRRCADLSGGQKQLLNLAAALVLRPPLLLLDEPLAQLDPATRRQFVGLLSRVQRELGLTVVVATHLSEEWEGVAEQVIDLGVVRPAREGGGSPTAARQQGVFPDEGECEGPGWDSLGEVVVSGRDLFFRYGASEAWVLRGFDVEVRRGSVHALVGGNGSGKTTLLRVLAGELKPRRGKVHNELSDMQAFLPQDPKAVFVCDSVDEELSEWQGRVGYSDEDVVAIEERFGLAGLGRLHPFDLSGGQRQMLALAKMLLTRPRLLLLDEPTKGLDARACAQVVRALRAFCDEGGTVVLATHDLDFTAVCADEATLLFDGQTACTQSVPKFFEGNLVWRPRERSRLYGELA